MLYICLDCYHQIQRQLNKVIKKRPDGLNVRIGDFQASLGGDSHIRALLYLNKCIMTVTKENGSNLPAVFTYGENNKVTTVQIENQSWFQGSDICNILDIKGSRDLIRRRLDDDEKMRLKIASGQNAWFVNESGLYNLIFRSNKPEAKVFRKWVTNEVLPALRKQGNYQIPEERKMLTGINERKLIRSADMTDLVYQAITICGSRSKLAYRLGMTSSTFSFVVNGRVDLFSEEALTKIEIGCKRIIAGTGNQTDMATINVLMSIEDKETRTYLFEKMKKGGLI